nr:hypothetical protein [Streptomyces sp. PRh5]
MSRAGHAGLAGPMTLIETPEETSLAYLEGQGKASWCPSRTRLGSSLAAMP